MAALAPSEPVMLAARVVQGVGGGVALTAVLGLINASYHGRARGIAFALYGATFAAACAAGPLLGAAIAETVSWRWAFGVNLIVGPLAFAGVVKLVPVVAPRATRRPDIAGMVLASGAVTAITFAIVQAQSYGWIHAERTIDLLGVTFHRGGIAPTPVVLGLAAVLFAAFALVERAKIAREEPAILDPALIRVRSFTHGSIGLLIVGMGEFGLVFLLPLALQAGAGLTAMEAGLLMLPTSVAAVVAFPLVQQVVTRTDQRTAVLVGLVLEAVGLTGIALAAEIGHPLAMLPGLAVYGLGIGAATAQLSALVLTEVPAAHNSLASGLSSAARHLGSSLGVAVLGVLFSAPLAQVSEGLADQPVQTVAAMHAAGQDTLIARARMRSATACASPASPPPRSC